MHCPPMQWVAEGTLPEIREADHSPPPTAEVKNSWRFPSAPQTSSRGNFNLSAYYIIVSKMKITTKYEEQWTEHSLRKFINTHTNAIQQSPSLKANSHPATQKIPHVLWNPKVCYRVHNSAPLVPILSQIHPVHNFPHYFPKIHSNIIFPSTPGSSEWSLPFRFSGQNSVWIYLSHAPLHTPSISFSFTLSA
jgi:hypothetical protein